MTKLWCFVAVACMMLSGQAAEPFRLARVAYVMLGSADLPAAVRFYRDKLGLKLIRQMDDVAFFDAGGIQIVISTEVGKQAGSTEVVFAVEHVEAAHEALQRQGIAFEHGPHAVTEAAWAANFRDTDGHWLSVFGPK